MHIFGKKNTCSKVHQLLFRIRFFVLVKFSVHTGSHMDAHRIYDLTVVLIQVYF